MYKLNFTFSIMKKIYHANILHYTVIQIGKFTAIFIGFLKFLFSTFSAPKNYSIYHSIYLLMKFLDEKKF